MNSLQENGFAEVPFFFSYDECQTYMQWMNKLFINDDDDSWIPDQYRRIKITNEELTTLVTGKLSTLFPNLSAHYKWFPTYYVVGGGLGIHCDGNAYDENNTSAYTILIYLNDDYKGGRTVFVNGYTDDSDDDIANEIASICPRQGLALLLRQDLLHYAEPVKEGVKYLLRGDLFTQ